MKTRRFPSIRTDFTLPVLNTRSLWYVRVSTSPGIHRLLRLPKYPGGNICLAALHGCGSRSGNRSCRPSGLGGYDRRYYLDRTEQEQRRFFGAYRPDARRCYKMLGVRRRIYADSEREPYPRARQKRNKNTSTAVCFNALSDLYLADLLQIAKSVYVDSISD
jgi:hypothetical protein